MKHDLILKAGSSKLPSQEVAVSWCYSTSSKEQPTFRPRAQSLEIRSKASRPESCEPFESSPHTAMLGRDPGTARARARERERL